MEKSLKKCPRCGSSFECQAETGGCWCKDVRLSGEMLGRLREKYSGCLCKTCLEQLEKFSAVKK